MLPTATASRVLSINAPIATEAERLLFQRRLAITLFVIFTLALGFLLLQILTVAFVFGVPMSMFFAATSVQLQVAVTFSALVGALFVRRGQPSAALLDIADVGSTLGLSVGWALMIYFEQHQPSEQRAELIALLATSYTLATRAALVPSTTARSALIGLGAMLPLPPIAYALAVDAGLGKHAAGPLIYVSIWALVGVACTTTISHVIYGLQLQVRKAMQLGQYLLEEKIGEGGMGVVYRASHALLRRPTAIKLLTGSGGQQAARFEREVQITARLTHPNTVAVFDYGRTPDGVFYYAMEYLDGITLEDLVRRTGALPAPRVVHLLLQVCGALEEAHAHGLVHRDIKPANIMVTARGGIADFVKVLDFGLVKESGAEGDPSVTGASTILGTPHFMAPEAIIDPQAVDARAGLYAVGATAYFMLTGSHVFDGSTIVEVCGQHLHQPPTPPSQRAPSVPAKLEQIVLACLEKQPSRRPADAGTVAESLREAGVGAWTAADARSWWSSDIANAPPSAAPEQSGSVSRDPFGNTVAVDFEQRATG